MKTVRIETGKQDFIAGGRIYLPDSEGFVEIPEDVAIAEGHYTAPVTPLVPPVPPLVPPAHPAHPAHPAGPWAP